MWMNFASGNICRRMWMRAVWVGDFNTIRFGLPGPFCSLRLRNFTCCRKRNSPAFQASASFRRDRGHIQKLVADPPAVGKYDGFVGGTETQIEQCKLVFLRLFPANRHVVHWPLCRQQEGEPSQQPAEGQTVSGAKHSSVLGAVKLSSSVSS